MKKGVQSWDLRSIGYIFQESKILKIPRQMVCPRSKISRIQRKSVWAGSKIFRICRQNAAVGSKIFRVFRQNVYIESKIFKIFRQNVSIGSKIFKIFRQNVAIGSKIFRIHRSWIFRIQDPGSFWDLGTSLLTTSRQGMAMPIFSNLITSERIGITQFWRQISK